MTDLLLELRSEEIPARMQDKARDDLSRLFTAELASAGIAATDIITYATPRRLALIARGLPDRTEPVAAETKGPRTGAPPQALEGFLRKTGLTRDQLIDRDGVWYAVVERAGRATTDVLADAIPAIVRAFPWPKSMRWGDASTTTESLRWVRPLHGIVALFGDTIVDVTVAGIRSGATTFGHRVHHPGAITLGGADDYVDKLHACHVIVDQDDRRALIRARAVALAAAAGLVLVADEGLVAENAGLTEWPVPLLGRFDAAYLDVPPEVIQLTARVNQKYFVCRDADGALANAFVCTANIDASDGGAKIVAGNRKVLAARLADAKFFYDTDRKVPLEEQAKKLGAIVFHEKLGTLADKVDRVAALARWLIEQDIVTDQPSPPRGGGLGEGQPEANASAPAPYPAGDKAELADLALRAARLAKADLVTGMVGEFPELQGVMGGYYAAAQGEDPRIAAAIRDHYKPVGQGDDVPTDPVTVAVSLADKLDTFVSFYAVGLKPTGSKDPFALRRAALGIIRLMLDNRLRVGLTTLICLARQSLLNTLGHTASLVEVRPDVGDDDPQPIAPKGEAFDVAADVYVVPSSDAGATYSRTQLQTLTPSVTKVAHVIDLIEDGVLYLTDRLAELERVRGVRLDLIRAIIPDKTADFTFSRSGVDGAPRREVLKIRFRNAGSTDSPVEILDRVRALQSFIGTEDGSNLLAGYKRAANILKKEGLGAAPQLACDANTALSYTPEKDEGLLIAALDAAEPAAADAVAREDFEGAMAALATLRAPIDAFFETVTVNDPDADKRTARLALLARVRGAVHNVADFSRIEG